MTELPSPKRNIELLTAVKAADASGAVRTKCFGNILELGCDYLVLESRREQLEGDALTLSLVFPGLRNDSASIVSLGCVVRRVRDAAELHYELAIEDMDEATRQQLVAYLSESGSGEEV